MAMGKLVRQAEEGWNAGELERHSMQEPKVEKPLKKFTSGS